MPLAPQEIRTYFITTDIATLGETDAIEFCLNIPERAGVVAIPTAIFYDDKAEGRTKVRFAFCKKPDVLDEALRRLAGVGVRRSVDGGGAS